MQKEIAPFFKKISEILTEKLPFVVFRKPNEELVSVISQSNNNLHELSNFNQVGFVFAPFEVEGKSKNVLFPLEECTHFSTKITPFDNLSIHENSGKLERIISSEILAENHISLVEKGIEFIKNNNAQKIVLSRKEEVEILHLDVLNTYKRMLRNYPNAFVYLWFHPAVGLWMGATPERLINLKQQSFKTMALAGTQPFLNTIDVVWNDKEFKEQQFVTDFILQNLKNKISNIQLKGPYTVKAGNLLHLRTDIFGELETSNSLENLIDSLHPTPAVCGLPKNIATQFILANEAYDRMYYAGYLGELNMHNSTHLFVNLRCMQLKNTSAIIYIGGGITADSNAKNEWEETISKAEVMKKVL